MEGGGGIDVDILLFIGIDNLFKEGQSFEGNKERLLNKICLNDIIMSGRIGGEEVPKVHEV
jgi:hypothetical protein